MNDVAQKQPVEERILTIVCQGDKQVAGLEASTVPGGKRLIVNYMGGTVKGTPDGAEIKGVVLSGADWIFVRNDDVAFFDGHFTIGLSALDVDVLQDIAATVRRELGKKPFPEGDFLVDFLFMGQAEVSAKFIENGGSVPFVIPVRMEAAAEAPPWAKARFTNLAAGATRFTTFLKKQCVAIGELTVDKKKVTKIEFDIRALVPDVAAQRRAFQIFKADGKGAAAPPNVQAVPEHAPEEAAANRQEAAANEREALVKVEDGAG